MKTKVSTWINMLITALLGLLGYSCNRVYMYGVPSADFTLEGIVTNENNEPLENIQIVNRGGGKDGKGNINWNPWADTLYTNADGTFYKYYYRTNPYKYYKVVVNDTTGTYASDSLETSITYSGSRDAWYEGQGSLKADFVLKK